MNWIILFIALEFGYAPIYESINMYPSEPEIITVINSGYMQIETEIILKDLLFLKGTGKVYVQTIPDVSAPFPFELDAGFNVGVILDNIEIGYRKLWVYPVRPYEMYSPPQQSNEAFYEEFYIKFSSK